MSRRKIKKRARKKCVCGGIRLWRQSISCARDIDIDDVDVLHPYAHV